MRELQNLTINGSQNSESDALVFSSLSVEEEKVKILSDKDAKKERKRTSNDKIFEIEKDDDYPYLFKKEIKACEEEIARIYTEAKIGADKKSRKLKIVELRGKFTEDPVEYYKKWRSTKENPPHKQLDCLEKNLENFYNLYCLMLIIRDDDNILQENYAGRQKRFTGAYYEATYNDYELDYKISFIESCLEKIFDGSKESEKEEINRLKANLEKLKTARFMKDTLIKKLSVEPTVQEIKQRLLTDPKVLYRQKNLCDLGGWNQIFKECRISDAKELHALLPQKKREWGYDDEENGWVTTLLICHPCDCDNCLKNIDKIVSIGIIPIMPNDLTDKEKEYYPKNIKEKLNEWSKITQWDNSKELIENMVTILFRSKGFSAGVTDFFGRKSVESGLIADFKKLGEGKEVEELLTYLKGMKEKIDTSHKAMQETQFYYTLNYLLGWVRREYQVELLAAETSFLKTDQVEKEKSPVPTEDIFQVSEIIAGYAGRW